MPKNWPKMTFWAKWLNFSMFWAFSPDRIIEIENGLLRCDQHLEPQVLSTHMPYFEEIFFTTSNRAYRYQKGQNWVGRTKKNIFLKFSLIYIHKNLPKKTTALKISWKWKMMTRPISHVGIYTLLQLSFYWQLWIIHVKS